MVISPSPSPSCLSAASSIDNLTTPLGDITVGGATGPVDGTSGSDRKEGEGTDVFHCVCVCEPDVIALSLADDITVSQQRCST